MARAEAFQQKAPTSLHGRISAIVDLDQSFCRACFFDEGFIYKFIQGVPGFQEEYASIALSILLY
jgi:hypothetical protein